MERVFKFLPQKKNLLRFYEVFTILYNAYIKLLVYKKENYNNFTTDAQYYNSLLLALVSTCTDAQYFMTRFFFFTLEWRFLGNFFTLCYLQRCFHWKKKLKLKYPNFLKNNYFKALSYFETLCLFTWKNEAQMNFKYGLNSTVIFVFFDDL